MDYINYLLNNNGYNEAKNVIWPIINNDLNYVAQYWNETGYDLWEEVAGSSFFTVMAQYRALVQGSHMAARLGVGIPSAAVIPQISCYLESYFWNATGSWVTANINTTTDRSGIDANPLLAVSCTCTSLLFSTIQMSQITTDHFQSINNFDIDGSCRGFQPCDSRMLSQHKVYVDAFRAIYPINGGIAANAAVATGRYPEDTYYGGNPWYLCTLSAAELLYDAAAQFRRQGRLVIDNISLAFLQQLYPSATIGTYQAPSQYSPGGPCWNNWGMSPWGGHTW